jgi:hypothetical protein
MANSDDDDLISQLIAQFAASAPGASNSILAGQGTLIRQMIQSPNYVAGVSGWTINKDGSAEFNNLTIRGTFAGTDFVINANGIFFYSGVPANGNLILALTNSAGVDAFGNVYIQGITIGNASGVQVLLQIVSGVQAAMRFPTNNPNENVAANITANANGGVTLAGFLQLVLSGPKTNVAGAQDWTQILFNSANYGNTSDASLDIIYIGSGGGIHPYATMDGTGFNVLAGSICAAKPGASPQIPETWTTLGLINGYTAGANNGFLDVPQVRLMADNKNLQFKGTLTTPAAAGTGIFTQIPSGYPNANLGGCFGMYVVANLAGGTVDHVQLHNNGNIGLNNLHNSFNFDISGVMTTQ